MKSTEVPLVDRICTTTSSTELGDFQPLRPMIADLTKKQRDWLKRAVKYQSVDLSRSKYFAKNLRDAKGRLDNKLGVSVFRTMIQNQMRLENCEEEDAYAMTVAGLYGWDLAERAIARRILRGSPRELMENLSLSARLSWLDYCHPYALRHDKYVNVWSMIQALAANDFAAAEAYAQHGGPRARGKSPTVVLYNFLRALLLDDEKEIAKSIKEAATIDAPDRDRAALYCLDSIANSSPTDLAESLEFLLSTYRRSLYVRDFEKIVSFSAHGFAELAYRKDPSLLHNFSVSRKLPWDSAYFNWLRKNTFTGKHIALQKQSPLLHAWLTNMKPPEWWFTKGKRL